LYYQQKIDFTPEETLDYLRKSRSDDPNLTVEEVLEKHEKRLDDWSEQYQGAKVPPENKLHELVSGETIADRPRFQELLKRIESPKIKAVKVVEISRLSRGDLEDAGRIIKLFRFTNTLIVTPERMYDVRDEYDREHVERELKRGNEYLEYTKKILNAGRLSSVQAGNFVGNYAPYGYDRTVVMDGKRRCPTLKINEEEAPYVRMVFDMYVNKNLGPIIICNKLDEIGAKPPKGEYWSPDTIRGMLANEHYIGKVRWNWRKTITIVEDGEYKKTRPKKDIGEFLVYEGRHEAIVSDELFYAARAKAGKNPRTKPTVKLRNPLAGMLFCRCGRAMTLRSYKHSAEDRFLCNGQTHCNTGSCMVDEIIERVCDVLEQCIEDFEIRLQNDNGDSIKLHNSMIENLKKRLKALEAKELAQWEAQASPDESLRMPPHIFKQLNEKLLHEKEEINQALCKAYESMPEPVNYEEKLARFKDALEALKDPEADVVKQNALLKECIDKIVYSRDKPERRKKPGKYVRKKLGEPLDTSRGWTSPPIELDIKLKV